MLLDLQRRLRQQPYHIIHFVGFAVHDTQTQAGVLVFEDEMGRGRVINGDHLGRATERSLLVAAGGHRGAQCRTDRRR